MRRYFQPLRVSVFTDCRTTPSRSYSLKSFRISSSLKSNGIIGDELPELAESSMLRATPCHWDMLSSDMPYVRSMIPEPSFSRTSV